MLMMMLMHRHTTEVSMLILILMLMMMLMLLLDVDEDADEHDDAAATTPTAAAPAADAAAAAPVYDYYAAAASGSSGNSSTISLIHPVSIPRVRDRIAPWHTTEHGYGEMVMVMMVNMTMDMTNNTLVAIDTLCPNAYNRSDAERMVATTGQRMTWVARSPSLHTYMQAHTHTPFTIVWMWLHSLKC